MNSIGLSNLEVLMVERRADLHREIEQLHLEREAFATRARNAGWVGHRMHDLSMWMISTGERMHQRYHDPAPMHRWYESFKVAR